MQDSIGIDISKDTLDIHRQSDGRHARFGNDESGLASLRRWIGKVPVRAVYEATGRYHRDMEAALDVAGHALVKVNPGRARRFAQAAGYGAKTDRVDAAMLARMGTVLELEATPVRSEAMHEIRELHIARLGLIKDRTACRNPLQAARNKVVLAQLRARLRQVERQCARHVPAHRDAPAQQWRSSGAPAPRSADRATRPPHVRSRWYRHRPGHRSPSPPAARCGSAPGRSPRAAR
jgi:transposase